MNTTNDDGKQEFRQDTSDDSAIINYKKNYKDNIIKFFDNNDHYGEKLHNYFMGLCSIDKEWMISDRSNKVIDENISLDKNNLKSFDDDNKTIYKSELKIIFQSYYGKLSQDSYHIRVFLASLYQLEKLDMNHPSPVWRWVGKLCQLLNYYLYKDDKRRIQDISNNSRLRLNPNDRYHQSWQSCIELQKGTLVQTYQVFSNYKEKIKNDNNQKYFINFFRNIEYAYQQKITNTHRVTTRKVVSRVAKPRMEIAKHPNIDEDNDELYILTQFHYHDVDINSTRLDDPHPDYITLSPSSLRMQEKYSPRQQRLRTLSKYDHLNKNNRHLAPNLRLLLSFAIKEFHDYLIKKNY